MFLYHTRGPTYDAHSWVLWFMKKAAESSAKKHFQDQRLHLLLGSLHNLKTPKVSARPQIEHPIEKQFQASASQENTQQGQFHSKEMSQIEKYISSHTGLNLLSNYSQDRLDKNSAEYQFHRKEGHLGSILRHTNNVMVCPAKGSISQSYIQGRR